MSERDEALALLRERFPAPWKVHVEAYGGGACSAIAIATLGGVQVAVSRPWEAVERPEGIMEAARACIAAWDEATDDMWGKAAAYAGVVASRDAEREDADRMAEALREHMRIDDLARVQCHCGGSAINCRMQRSIEALAVHDARRAPRNEMLDHGDDVGAEGMDRRKP